MRTEKKAYNKPVLSQLGAVTELTTGGSGMANENRMMMMMGSDMT